MPKKKQDKEVDYVRLLAAAESSRLGMEEYRRKHVENVRHLCGSNYSTNAARKKIYVNLVQLYVSIVGRSLIAKNPRVMLSTMDRGQKPTVAAMEQWVNEEIERRNLADVYGRIVTNALFSVGIGKVALASPADSANFAWNVRAGSPFLECIELDDYVFDTHARSISEASFQGHRYRVPLDVIQQSDLYDKEGRDALTASEHVPYNEQGDERIGMIGRGYLGIHNEFEPMVDLWEFYLPRYRLVCTFADHAMRGAWAYGSGKDGQPVPLRVQKWLGPPCGPYHILAMQTLPGNPFPKGPVQDVVDLHEVANETYRKLVRQAARLKTITLTRSSDDYERIKKTNDGEGTWCDDPKATQEVTMGGPHQSLGTFFIEVFNRFSLMAGNLMTMGGLGTQANTLGQEELLATQSNGQVASMQETTYKFVADSMKAMMWYWWNDPLQVQKTSFSLPGMPDMSIQRRVAPWSSQDPRALKRNGPMPQISVDPYSMRRKTPQQRAQALTQFVTQVFIPLAQAAAQQGVAFDFNAYAGLMAKFIDEPDLQTILTIQTPPQQESGPGGGDQMAGPANTSREYVRRDAGGGPDQGQAMMDMMKSAGVDNNGRLQQM